MTIPVSLIKVGNSKAIIIPAKILKRMNITEDTQLQLEDTDSTINISKIGCSPEKLVFPQVNLPAIDQNMLDDLIHISAEEIAGDERLQHILR